MNLATDAPPFSAPTIMIVDDDGDIREMMCEALRGEGYVLIEAASAADAEDKAVRDLPHLYSSTLICRAQTE